MITICSRWESSQMSPELEWRMWCQLRGAFGINRFVFTPVVPEMNRINIIDQYDNMKEALDNCQGEFIFLEHKGIKTLSDLPKGRDVVFVLGNTHFSNLEFTLKEDAYRILTPYDTDLYGINAAAIALSFYVGQ